MKISPQQAASLFCLAGSAAGMIACICLLTTGDGGKSGDVYHLEKVNDTLLCVDPAGNTANPNFFEGEWECHDARAMWGYMIGAGLSGALFLLCLIAVYCSFKARKGYEPLPESSSSCTPLASDDEGIRVSSSTSTKIFYT